MAECLIALGSNLGDRAAQLRLATDALDRTPQTRVVSRSAWHDTPPIGGPAGQGPYLNGAVLAATSLAPAALWAALRRIESQLGRVRDQRWEARTIDLDMLLYGAKSCSSAELVIPHPRMQYRRFVLEPAVEAAPWMVHPESGWTVARLWEQLNRGVDEVAVAAADPHLGVGLAERLAGHFGLTKNDSPRVRPWTPDLASAARPKLILAAPDATGSIGAALRKILQLPATGPVAWVTPGDANEVLRECAAAVSSVWPELTPTSGAS